MFMIGTPNGQKVFTPTAKQLHILDLMQRNSHLLYFKRRQIGFSTLLCYEVMRRLEENNNYTVLWLSPTRDSNKVRKQLFEINCLPGGTLQPNVVKNIQFASKAEPRFNPAHFDLVILDEVCWIREEALFLEKVLERCKNVIAGTTLRFDESSNTWITHKMYDFFEGRYNECERFKIVSDDFNQEGVGLLPGHNDGVE